MSNDTAAYTLHTIITQMGTDAAPVSSASSLVQEAGGVAAYFGLPAFVYAFALIGIYALCWWLIDNLRSLVQLVAAVLTPYFQPSDDKSLVDRFGGWAGRNIINICPHFIYAFECNTNIYTFSVRARTWFVIPCKKRTQTKMRKPALLNYSALFT